jgi:hypothetical protein
VCHFSSDGNYHGDIDLSGVELVHADLSKDPFCKDLLDIIKHFAGSDCEGAGVTTRLQNKNQKQMNSSEASTSRGSSRKVKVQNSQAGEKKGRAVTKGGGRGPGNFKKGGKGKGLKKVSGGGGGVRGGGDRGRVGRGGGVGGRRGGGGRGGGRRHREEVSAAAAAIADRGSAFLCSLCVRTPRYRVSAVSSLAVPLALAQ